MASWLIAALSAYLILAIVSIGDKFLLDKVKLHYKEYAFYSGLFSSLLIIAIPFIKINFSLGEILLATLSGFLFILAVMYYFKAMNDFDASQIVPTVNAMIPICSFVFGYVLSIIFPETFEKFILSGKEILAFFFLVAGSFFINYQDGKINHKSFVPSFVSSSFFAISLLTANIVYSRGSFIEGFLWIKLGWAIFTLILFSDKDLRKHVLTKKRQKAINRKQASLVIVTQLGGGLGGLLQAWAIALVEFSKVPILNALQGVQYVFLLFFSFILSKFFPHILAEDISSKVLVKKMISVILIAVGLAILMLF
ncbi:MAG TPA: hypothetical protein PKL98_01210 [Candidatus Pacearchaeota archaeon]|nr:hypothetical protein [Candidatus Parcubacteria bacterium]HNZ83873.1 hypothetical protein [Candidatus Pacearchaeota archaeon]HPM08430.1 hypothetical protein [Candidatus Pacearchaeota archaeon]